LARADKWQGKPLHEAILAQCQELGVANAVVYRGIEGYGSSTRIHRAESMEIFTRRTDDGQRHRHRGADRKADSAYLDAMVGDGLIVTSKVDVTRYTLAASEPRAS
jgi:hypothetical protein